MLNFDFVASTASLSTLCVVSHPIMTLSQLRHTGRQNASTLPSPCIDFWSHLMVCFNDSLISIGSLMSAWLDFDVDVDVDLVLRLQNCSLRTFWALADFCWMYASFLWAGEYVVLCWSFLRAGEYAALCWSFLCAGEYFALIESLFRW